MVCHTSSSRANIVSFRFFIDTLVPLALRPIVSYGLPIPFTVHPAAAGDSAAGIPQGVTALFIELPPFRGADGSAGTPADIFKVSLSKAIQNFKPFSGKIFHQNCQQNYEDFCWISPLFQSDSVRNGQKDGASAAAAPSCP